MMKKTQILTLALLGLLTHGAHAAITYAAGDMSSGVARSNFTGALGIRFGVAAPDIPAGQDAVVTRLGFYAGRPGEFTGAGVVDHSHVVTLYGPRPYATRAGDYSALQVAQVTISAGAAVDAGGWAWADLGSAVTLTPAEYYSVLANVVNGQSDDPFFNPGQGTGASTLSVIAPEVVLRQGGTGGGNMIARWGTGANLELATGADAYLAANVDISLVPEPSSAALLGLAGLGLLIRRKR